MILLLFVTWAVAAGRRFNSVRIPEEKFAEWACQGIRIGDFLSRYDEHDKVAAHEYYRQFHKQVRHLYHTNPNWMESLCSTGEISRIRKEQTKPQNKIDSDGTCPDQLAGLTPWPYEEDDESKAIRIDGESILLDRNVTVKRVVIENGGRLIFKDAGDELIRLRAKNILIRNNGELWIGSRSCRYQGRADIAIYGNVDLSMEHAVAGQKYLLVDKEGVLEIHGKDKVAWTKLNDHLYANNIPVNAFDIEQKAQIYNRLVFHTFSDEGDNKELQAFVATDPVSEIASFIEANRNDKIFCVTDGFFPITAEFADIFDLYGLSSISTVLRSDYVHPLYTQFAFFFSPNGGEPSSIYRVPDESVEGQMMIRPMNGSVAMPLGGMKAGAVFRIDVDFVFDDFDLEQNGVLQRAILNDYNWDVKWNIRKNWRLRLHYRGYSSPLEFNPENPKITLDEDVSSWEVGDEIVVAATGFDVSHTEVFKIVDCNDCSAFQLRLNQSAAHTHWGRLDIETGIDQKAEVGLLSRNVRFYGEVGDTCQYAKTRDSLEPDTCTHMHGGDWCWYFNQTFGERDMHGAHMIFLKDFKNVHISHAELFQAGQPRLARYPIHWHMAGNVGGKKYDDPSFVDSLSIHHSFSRFVTIHGTDGATVSNVVGYRTHGHGFFLEDGNEIDNKLINNLGIDVREGILLPTDRAGSGSGYNGSCASAYDSFDCQPTGDDACNMLSVFWISNQQNMLHGNHAVGGHAGFWILAHRYCTDGQTNQTMSEAYATTGPMFDPESGLHEWRGNKASACEHGIQYDITVKDLNCAVDEQNPGPRFGKDPVCNDVRSLKNGLQFGEGNGQIHIHLTGWKLHHAFNRCAWVRNGWVTTRDSEISDCAQGWTYPTTPDLWSGGYKTLVNNTFVGMSKNTGEYPCQHDNPAPQLNMIKDCRTKQENQHPYQLGLTNIVNKQDTYLFFYKSDDGIYRTSGFDIYFPTRGFALYDTWYPAITNNNRFFDYPSKTNLASAIGSHLGNDFGMINHQCWMKGNTFVRVDKKFFNSDINCYERNCEKFTPFQYFGTEKFDDNWPDKRMLGDGEITQGCIDEDGHIFGKANSMLIPKAYTLLYKEDACDWVTEGPNEGDLLCDANDFEISVVRMSVKPKTYDHGIDFQRVDKALGVTTLHSGIPVGDGRFTLNGNVDSHYTARFKANPGATFEIQSSLEHTNTGSSFWLSFCMRNAVVTKIFETYKKVQNDGDGQRVEERREQEILAANSIEEMMNHESGPSWYFDDQGWLHTKLVQYLCRECGGVFQYYDSASPDQQFPFPAFDHFTCNPEHGCIGIQIDLDTSNFDFANDCPDFEMPETTTTTTTTTKKTTTEEPTTTTTEEVCPCTDDVTGQIFNGFTPFFAKFGQIKGYASGANTFAFAMAQTIHDAEKNPGMPAGGHDGYIVIRKYNSCDHTVMEKFADPSVTWEMTDFTCGDCYTSHQGGYFKDDVANKKKTFTLGYSFNNDGTDTNKASQVDKYLLMVTGLQALGVTEQQAFDCLAGAKPANMYGDFMEEGCDYSHCVGEKVLIW